MQFFKNPNIDFMNSRKLAFLISGSLMLLSILSLIIHGGPRFGIDFKGGTFIELRFEDKNNPEALLNIPIDKVRDALAKHNLASSEIKHYGSPQEIAIQTGVEKEVDIQILESLQEEFPEYNVIERRKETVGPKIGGELVEGAIKAIFVSLGLILIYIMFRFEFRYGVGAVAALFHDVLITLGVFSLLDIEVSIPIVAALLTIVGYSLNDTIVVYDRIRENMKKRVTDYQAVVNSSINQTLSRTIITSGTTLLVVIILFFFGGEIIKDFALALLCGIVVGTYSSIFIASPILVEWEARKKPVKVTAKRK
ncbi:MAG: protein translocase subunit SecF [Calditrichaeota bacterium]|nr:MAG: protein translocase subunit SecF [Calditrichota bacterium]